MEAEEAAGKDRDEVLLVVDVHRVERRVDEVGEGLVARLSPVVSSTLSSERGRESRNLRGASRIQYVARSRSGQGLR
jgi:hypothetical protein